MTTGLDVFDTTVQETNLWLKDLMSTLEIEDRHLAYRLLRATLHALRDRIGPTNAVHLGAQLPMLLRGVYYDGWRMQQTKERHLEAFLNHVDAETRNTLGVETEKGVRAVFEVLWKHIDPAEAEKLANMFPEELRDLWWPCVGWA